MGPRSVAIQAVPAGVVRADAEKLAHRNSRRHRARKRGHLHRNAASQNRRLHRVPRRDQSQHAARPNENGMAACRARQNRLPDELPARPPGRSALFRKRNRERLPPHLKSSSDISPNSKPMCASFRSRGHSSRGARGMTETQKTAVIFGLANKRSIAWAIAQKLQRSRLAPRHHLPKRTPGTRKPTI